LLHHQPQAPPAEVNTPQRQALQLREMRRHEKKQGNRLAAKKCRDKRKQYVETLEAKVNELEDQRSLLLRELNSVQTQLQTV